MSKVISTSSGENFLRKYSTPADKSFINDVQLYEKYVGSDGASNTIFTLNGTYILGSNQLLVFVNGQKAEKVTTATDETEYEETSTNSVTFGDSLLDADVVEFYVVGTYNVEETDITNMVESGAIPTASFKNKIINGKMDVWQRGTTGFTATTELTADRWRASYTGTSKSVSRQSFTIGQTDVPNNPKYYIRHVGTTSSAAGDYQILSQRIEDVTLLASKTITVSWYAKADASKLMALEFRQYFGTGGSPSSTIDKIGVKKVSLTTGWTQFSHTFTVPSVSGKTLGTNNDDFFEMRFWFDAGSTYNDNTDSMGNQSGTFDICLVQIEEGTLVTPFDDRHISQEISMCQRYFCKTYDLTTNPGTVTDDGRRILYLTNHSNSDHTMQFDWRFPVQMRDWPTVTLYNDQDGTSGEVRMISGGITPTSTNVNETSLYVSATNGAASTSRLLTFQATADAEL